MVYTQCKDPTFGIHMDTLCNFRLSGKNLQLEPLGKEYSDLVEELTLNIMGSSFLKNTFGLTQTAKPSAEGRNIINLKVKINLGVLLK